MISTNNEWIKRDLRSKGILQYWIEEEVRLPR